MTGVANSSASWTIGSDVPSISRIASATARAARS
jgi:hypothetical protein